MKKIFNQISKLYKKHPSQLWWSCLILVLIAGLLILTLNFEAAAKFFFSGDSPKGELLKVILTTIGGFAVIVGLFINNRRVKAMEEQNDLTEKGKRDERFKNAVEHLADSRAAVTLGGIHSLHRIAEEDKSYRPVVFDILCSYIRETTTQKEYQGSYADKPSLVIQTILDTIFKCAEPKKYLYEGLRANLNHAYLVGTNMVQAIMPNAILFYTVFQKTDFRLSEMQNTDLRRTNLKSATLSGANLQNADLTEANLEEAIIIETNLQNSTLVKANFKNAEIMNTKLEGSAIVGTDFTGTIIYKTLSKNQNQ